MVTAATDGGAAADWVRSAPPCPGLERLEAFFAGRGFAPHRHDTYAVGHTIQGVQAFRYRGAAAHSVAGRTFVLHPDESHDGHAGTEAGFRYRILYVAPALIGEALGRGGRPLPFLRNPVTDDRRIAAALRPALEDLDLPLDELRRDEVVQGLADALAAADPSFGRRRPSAPHRRAVDRARALLDASLPGGVGSAELEAATGLDRYAAARHFRACLGTSPHRYLTMRRLDEARRLIGRGVPLADAALASGFADQSHMTRHFRKTYGLPPGRWAGLQR